MKRWLMLNMTINYTIFILFFVSLLLIPYSLLYKKETLQIKSDLGITLPKPFKIILEINIVMSIIVSLMLLMLIVLQLN